MEPATDGLLRARSQPLPLGSTDRLAPGTSTPNKSSVATCTFTLFSPPCWPPESPLSDVLSSMAGASWSLTKSIQGSTLARAKRPCTSMPDAGMRGVPAPNRRSPRTVSPSAKAPRTTSPYCSPSRWPLPVRSSVSARVCAALLPRGAGAFTVTPLREEVACRAKGVPCQGT